MEAMVYVPRYQRGGMLLINPGERTETRIGLRKQSFSLV